jgi:hypothetical protein
MSALSRQAPRFPCAQRGPHALPCNFQDGTSRNIIQVTEKRGLCYAPLRWEANQMLQFAFSHRPLQDGAYASICNQCCATVARSHNEADLEAAEKLHTCGLCDETRGLEQAEFGRRSLFEAAQHRSSAMLPGGQLSASVVVRCEEIVGCPTIDSASSINDSGEPPPRLHSDPADQSAERSRISPIHTNHVSRALGVNGDRDSASSCQPESSRRPASERRRAQVPWKLDPTRYLRLIL